MAVRKGRVGKRRPLRAKKEKRYFGRALAYAAVILIVVVGLGFGFSSTGFFLEEQDFEAAATCLTGKGVVMYGSFDCGACQKQKLAFGNGFQHVNYIECSPEWGSPEICQKMGIEFFPTWIINGKKHVGVFPAERLAELAGC